MERTVYSSRRRAPDLRVAVVGGGPAGSGFALFALDYARRAGIDLEITIYEPRDFTKPGPWGCNMCAGLIPVHMLRHLNEIGVQIPSHVIRNHIGSYTLHTAAGAIHLPQPDPRADVISVYRGNGPRNGPNWGRCISFDGFLLQEAIRRGARHEVDRVTRIQIRPRAEVATRTSRYACNLVVLATGCNGTPIEFVGLDYQAPRRSQMAQTELLLAGADANEVLNHSVHIVLPQGTPHLKFGTLVPKGPCINVSLLGLDLPRGSVDRFLRLPQVQAILAGHAWQRICRCRPHIAVTAARPLFADRFVAVGDAGITRLYKNGIGMALRTARWAAYTAVNFGTTEAAFRRHYGPVCQQIALDNLAGRLLFALTPLFQNQGWFAGPQLISVAQEQRLPPAARVHSLLLWGMFTGAYPYLTLLRMALNPRIHGRLLTAWLRHTLGSRVEDDRHPLSSQS